jgi:hypothetical protein
MQARIVEETQFRIVMLNINGVMSWTRIDMLEEFLREQDIDVMFVQEATHSILDNIWGYTAYTNLGATRRRKAFIARDHLELQGITCVLSGRALRLG